MIQTYTSPDPTTDVEAIVLTGEDAELMFLFAKYIYNGGLSRPGADRVEEIMGSPSFCGTKGRYWEWSDLVNKWDGGELAATMGRIFFERFWQQADWKQKIRSMYNEGDI